MSKLIQRSTSLETIFALHELVFPRLDELPDEAVGTILVHLISHISEEYHCAGWLKDIEYTTWNYVTDSRNKAPGSPAENAFLKRLHQRLAGGWVRYGEDGVELLTAEEWSAHLDSWRVGP